jgi:hypothetical protein
MGAQYFRFTGYGVPTSFRIRSPNPLDTLPKPIVGFQSRIPHIIKRETDRIYV